MTPGLPIGLLLGAGATLALTTAGALAQQAQPDAAASAATQDAAPVTGALAGAAAPAAPTDAKALREAALAVFAPLPDVAEVPKDNQATPERIELGAQLFFDPRMSRSGLISCQTCHNVGLAGIDGEETSIGHGWQQGPRNAPTVLNAVLNVAQFWDGRAEDLAAQAKGPLQAAVEMNNTPENLIVTLKSIPGYADAFKAAYPDEQEPVTLDTFAHAVEAFESTLLTPNAPFDKFLNGDDAALSYQQQRGLQAFMDTGCSTCHTGVNLGGQDYFPFGVVEKPGADILPETDEGRFSVTQTAGDEYVFRAAPLRNVALTPPYFHSGKVWDLSQAVKIMSSAQLGSELTSEQATDIVAFLDSLTGDQPKIEHPVLPPRGPDTPKPDPLYKN